MGKSVKVIIVKTKQSKNFGLHESEFHEMCVQLKSGDETIFERIYLNHFKPCQYYLKSSLGASKDESHDATMQTLLNFRRSLILGKVKYGNLNFLFTQMAYYEVIKSRKKSSTNIDRNLEYFRTASVELSEDEEDAHNNLVNVIASLPQNQKQLIVSHYYNKMKLTEIAEREGVPSTTLRKRKERILKTIKSRLSESLNFKK